MKNRPAAHDDSTLFRLDDLVAIAATTTAAEPTTALTDPLDALDIAPPLSHRVDTTEAVGPAVLAPAVLAPTTPRPRDRRLVALVSGFAVIALSTAALAAAVVVKYASPQPIAAERIAPAGDEPMFVTLPESKSANRPALLVVPKVDDSKPATKAKAKGKAKTRVKFAAHHAVKTKTETKTKAKAKTNTKTKTNTSGGELNALINSIGEPGKAPSPAVPAAPAASKLPKSLERSEIQQVMRTQVFSAVARCYERFHVPGFVHTKITIARRGKAQVRIGGRFARTPTGSCVADAVRRAKFPAFSGAPITVRYPFRLR